MNIRNVFTDPVALITIGGGGCRVFYLLSYFSSGFKCNLHTEVV